MFTCPKWGTEYFTHCFLFSCRESSNAKQPALVASFFHFKHHSQTHNNIFVVKRFQTDLKFPKLDWKHISKGEEAVTYFAIVRLKSYISFGNSIYYNFKKMTLEMQNAYRPSLELNWVKYI